MVEIITNLPILICFTFLKSEDYGLQFFVMIDCLRLFTYPRYIKHLESEIIREGLTIVLNLIFLSISMACYVQFVENLYLFTHEDSSNKENQDILFYQFFFIMTTASTIGYGSSITSDAGRIPLMLFIPFVFVYVPNSCGRLLDLINSKSVYARASYKTAKGIDFIILIGSVKQTSLVNFLEEFFHEDHGDLHNRHCVLMQPVRPTSDTELIMQKYSATMRYIEGSSLSESDLKRCHVYKAEAVIILSDKFSFDAEIEDTETILQAMFIKNFLSQLKKSQDPYFKEISFETRVCMQLLRPESITNYELSLNAEERLNDQIVCIESMKLSLLSKSCLCPGLVVLITNLIKSSGSPYDYLENYKEDPNYSWLYDYWSGKGYEIYRVKIG